MSHEFMVQLRRALVILVKALDAEIEKGAETNPPAPK